MQIGARTIKTGIAVMLTMLICHWINLEPAFFGAISAVINMQPSVFLSFKAAREQVLIQILGAVTAIAFGHLFGGGPLSMGVVTIVIIAACQQFNLQGSISAGVVAAVFILSSSPDQFLAHSLERTSVIFIGMVTALAVNLTLWPPRYNQQFQEQLQSTNLEAVRYFIQSIREYAQTETTEPAERARQELAIQTLRQNLRRISQLRRKEGTLWGVSSGGTAWLRLSKQFMEYTDGLIEKAQHIAELARQQREKESEDVFIPQSPEFRSILDKLDEGALAVERLNSKLRSAFLEEQPPIPEAYNEHYWDELKKAIEEWQSHFTSSYHLHSLIEISVLAHELRAASRQAKALLQEVYEETSDENP